MLLALPVLAQDKAQTLPEMVVTASRVAVPVTDVIADVSWIDRLELDQAGQASLRDVVVPVFTYMVMHWWLLPIYPELHDTSLILATVYGASILGVLTFVLRRMDRLDLRRRDAESARDQLFARLQQQAANLEVLVGDRTSELQKTTERLDLALRAGRFGVWDWDMVSKRVYWDHHQCALYGMTPAQFDGTTSAWLNRLHPDDRHPTQEQIGRALAAGEGFDCIFRIQFPDGSERFIQSLGVLRRDASGRVTRVVGLDRDITEQHAHARELATVNDRLQLAIKATGYGVWEMDLDTRAMIWDDRMLEIYGIDRDSFSGEADEEPPVICAGFHGLRAGGSGRVRSGPTMANS